MLNIIDNKHYSLSHTVNNLCVLSTKAYPETLTLYQAGAQMFSVVKINILDLPQNTDSV